MTRRFHRCDRIPFEQSVRKFLGNKLGGLEFYFLAECAGMRPFLFIIVDLLPGSSSISSSRQIHGTRFRGRRTRVQFRTTPRLSASFLTLRIGPGPKLDSRRRKVMKH
jgi:hypothetical protein